jgi:hypothetical protein
MTVRFVKGKSTSIEGFSTLKTLRHFSKDTKLITKDSAFLLSLIRKISAFLLSLLI